MASADCKSWTEITSEGCSSWEEIGGGDNCTNWVGDDDWILVTAFWQDTEHFWRDIAFWRDSLTNWMPVNG